MARKAKTIKVQLGELVLKKLTEIDSILKSRGSVEHNISHLMDFIFENADPKLFDSFVSQNTPSEYKLKQLYQNPEARKKIEALLESSHFGLD